MAAAATQQEDWASAAAREFAESARSSGLSVPIEAVANVFRQIQTVEGDFDLGGITRVYSTDEAAQFFGRSTQWLYWGMKPRDDPSGVPGGGLFYYPDGRAIEPERIGVKGIRRFTLDVIKDMSVALYQRGTIKLPELEEIVKRIHLARLGKWAPKPPEKKPARPKKTPTKRKIRGPGVTAGAEQDSR